MAQLFSELIMKTTHGHSDANGSAVFSGDNLSEFCG